MELSLDHFIYAGHDLEALSQQFEQLTGIVPGKGGRHPGLGTHNALASLGSDIYFELLAIDPTQVGSLDGTMGGRIRAMNEPRLLAYMLRGQELERQQAVLTKHGIGADLFDASRNTLDGTTLSWRLLVPHAHPLGDFIPKFIDWKDTVHPAKTSVSGCAFESFELGHPEAGKINDLLGELGSDLRVQRASAGYFQLRVKVPKESITFVG
jgi:hypothetical protein